MPTPSSTVETATPDNDATMPTTTPTTANAIGLDNQGNQRHHNAADAIDAPPDARQAAVNALQRSWRVNAWVDARTR